MEQNSEILRIAIVGYPEKVGNYLAALKGCGVDPVVIDAAADAAAFDGLVLPGGVDVSPAYYGQKNTACGEIDDALDTMQMKVTEAFLHAGKPILGICRGHQLLNVFFGGTLIQHIPQFERHAVPSGSHEDKVHEVLAQSDSFLSALYGTRFSANSSHHQAVDCPGNGFTVCAVSDDGVAEAIEHASLPVYGVQFHPERMSFAHRRADTVDGRSLFDAFLAICAKAAGSAPMQSK